MLNVKAEVVMVYYNFVQIKIKLNNNTYLVKGCKSQITNNND